MDSFFDENPEIDAKFGQEAQNLLQDEVVYQRAVNRKKTKLYGVMEHEIPNEFKKIETYNLETKSMVEENFHEEREGLEFFYIPSLLHVSFFIFQTFGFFLKFFGFFRNFFPKIIFQEIITFF